MELSQLFIKVRRRDGIALILVLGFLSILVVLGVAFVISMRTERLATRSYVDAVKARHLLPVCLARALNDIDAEIGAGVYPPWGVYGSTNAAGSGDACTNFLNGLALEHVPDGLLAEAHSVAGDPTTPVRWQTITDQGETIGRYAYLAVDCSGLLDANYVGGLLHTNGSQVGEISVDPDILAEVSSVSVLMNAREVYKRFESLPELWKLGTDVTGALADVPDKLFFYSYFRMNQYLDFGPPAQLIDKFYIGGDEDSVKASVGDIESQFAEMGLSLADAQVLAHNFRDYIDSDFEPNNGFGLETICTEPVPMINEIVITNTVTASDSTGDDVYVNRLDITVELFYPFVTTNFNAYTVEVDIWTPQGGTAGFKWPVKATLKGPLNGPWSNTAPYRVVNLSDSKTYTVSPSGSGPKPSLPGVLVCECAVRQGNMASSGYLVDKVSLFGVPWADFQLAANPNDWVPDPDGENSEFIAREIDDPRINWNWGTWSFASPPVHTLGAQNAAVTFATDPDADGVWQMYVRNDDYLPNVGELGFLLYDVTKPWQTIRLINRGVIGGAVALPVLDRFTVGTNAVGKGLVNPNTFDEDVLVALLYQAPIQQWWEEVSPTVNVAQAQALATEIVANGPYPNLASISNITDAVFDTALGAGALNAAEKENVIRHIAGLLSPRQNLFTVFLAVQSINDNNGVPGIQEADIRAESRAVAVVWRDPYPDASGRHPTFVRFFKRLTE